VCCDPGNGSNVADQPASERVLRRLQARVINPLVKLAWAVGIPPPGDALLETTGRRTGRPRRTPVCDGLDGDTFWLIAQRGDRADWVRNIHANPHVRVKVASWPHTHWRTGTALILRDDDVRQRQQALSRSNLARRLCIYTSRAMDTSPLTVRIDLSSR
jgi:deazaflavin-dependent oxidoreductase (nitroreductase family)